MLRAKGIERHVFPLEPHISQARETTVHFSDILPLLYNLALNCFLIVFCVDSHLPHRFPWSLHLKVRKPS